MTPRFGLLDWFYQRHHRRHRWPCHVALRIDDVLIILPPGETMRMEINRTVGKTTPLSIRYLDQTGAPMEKMPVADAPPVWTNSNPAVGTLSASADGLDAHEELIGPGTDIVSLGLMVGGISFSATINVIAAAPPPPPAQTLTSVEIVAGDES